jgi:hypothetical protein
MARAVDHRALGRLALLDQRRAEQEGAAYRASRGGSRQGGLDPAIAGRELEGGDVDIASSDTTCMLINHVEPAELLIQHKTGQYGWWWMVGGGW